MKKLLTIIKREYITRIRTKGFIIGTILMPVFILGVTIVPAVIAVMTSEEQKSIAVIDFTQEVYDGLQRELDRTNDAGERIYLLKRMIVKPENLEPVKQNLTEEVNKDKFFGFIIIPKDVFEGNEVEFYAKNVSNFRQNEEIQEAVSRIIREIRIRRAGLDSKLVEDITREVSLKTFKIGPGGEKKEERGQTFIVAYLLVFFLYMAMILYGTFVMRAVIEDKSSRVVELLVSSVNPFKLMAGKIFGVGAVGLTQFIIWALAAALIMAYSGALLGMFGVDATGKNLPIIDLDMAILAYFVLFFLLGYILYATMYAAVGAMVNAEQEAQQLVTPLILLLIVPMIMITYIIGNPHTTTSVVFSMIPFFAPMIMFTRIAVDMPPLPEILLSIAILIGSILLLIFLVAKIFRIGILMYGKRPTLPEVLRWLRQS